MKFVRRLFVFLFLALLVCGSIPTGIGYMKYKTALEKTPLSLKVKELQEKENYTTYDEIPKTFVQAMVAVEDKRFYKHSGIDYFGTLRAIVRDIQAKELIEGGSTVTQQLAKNLYFPKDSSLSRKIAEMLMARHIESKYSKDEIFEFYANCIYYGSGYYCIYDAALGYFKHKPNKMTDYECTLLAGIPNAPSVYSLDNNPDLAKQRQKKVVSSMVKAKYITQKEADSILNP